MRYLKYDDCNPCTGFVKGDSMRPTRKDAQRQTRDRLIAAAHASIVEEGVAAMSIRNICSAAGHSQGAFYSNFASKDDLLVDILHAHIRDEVALLRNLVTHTASDDIENILRMLVDRLAMLADEPQWSLLSIELQLHARRNPDFAARHREGKAACYRAFADLIADLVQRFGLTPALPPMQAGIALYALWAGLSVQGYTADAVPREQMLTVFFRALSGLPAPQAGRDRL